jgi:hypothetical protein
VTATCVSSGTSQCLCGYDNGRCNVGRTRVCSTKASCRPANLTSSAVLLTPDGFSEVAAGLQQHTQHDVCIVAQILARQVPTFPKQQCPAAADSPIDCWCSYQPPVPVSLQLFAAAWAARVLAKAARVATEPAEMDSYDILSRHLCAADGRQLSAFILQCAI